MSDREHQRLDFLAAAGLADAARTPLAGDASTRRYERLTLETGTTLMLMDQPPATESQPCDPSWTPAQRRASGWNAVARLSAGRIEAFAAVGDQLRSAGLSTPKMPALDADAGLAVLEDFGDALFARVIEDGQDEAPLYLAAVEALVRLHETPVPEVLRGPAGDWPLQVYDATALKGGADLFIEWLPRLKPELRFSEIALAQWDDAWAGLVQRAEREATVMAHRDFHAENLIWLPDRAGPARVGMIDFQDAVRAHPSWDLHSLLQDARRDVSPALEALALDHYFTLRPDLDREAFMRDYAALATLNEARILGIFARLIVRDGKDRYAAFMPRMWNHLTANLPDADQRLWEWFDQYVPMESRS